MQNTTINPFFTTYEYIPFSDIEVGARHDGDV